MRHACLLVSVALLAAGLLVAGPSAAVAEPPTEVTLDRGTHAALGTTFGAPLGATADLDLLVGLGADVREGREQVKAVCAAPLAACARGFLLHAAAGSGGGRLGIGVGGRARVAADDFHGTVGAGLRLTVARTWGSPVGTLPGLTYVGPETDLTVWRVALTLGTLWRVAGTGGDRLLFSWGVGLRL
jgi:hypothetical protein